MRHSRSCRCAHHCYPQWRLSPPSLSLRALLGDPVVLGAEKPPVEGAEAGAASASVPPSQAGPIGSSNSCGRTAGSTSAIPSGFPSPQSRPPRNPPCDGAGAAARYARPRAPPLLCTAAPSPCAPRLRGAGPKPSIPRPCPGASGRGRGTRPSGTPGVGSPARPVARPRRSRRRTVTPAAGRLITSPSPSLSHAGSGQ